MIIPVRCFTCGRVLADKWEYYQAEYKKRQGSAKRILTLDDLPSVSDKGTGFDSVLMGDVLDKLDLTRACCRRHFLGHVDLIEDL